MAKLEEFCFRSSNGAQVCAYQWPAQNSKAVVQIVHGCVEYAMRYRDFAESLAQKGFSVYAIDLLGHGKTAGSPDNVGHFSDRGGAFLTMVEDIHAMTERIKAENPGLPVFLYGHSMGSMLARVYAAKYGGELSGVLLTGAGGKGAAFLTLMIAVARCNMILFGARHRSALLNKLYNDVLNKPFPGDTGNEFLCSDPAVVAAFTEDEYCGKPKSSEFFHELLWGTREAASKRVITGFPKNVPLFIGAGEFDSLGGEELCLVKKDVAAYKKAGADVTFNIYPGMRHEILNEKQKQKVWDDIAIWLEQRTAVR